LSRTRDLPAFSIVPQPLRYPVPVWKWTNVINLGVRTIIVILPITSDVTVELTFMSSQKVWRLTTGWTTEGFRVRAPVRPRIFRYSFRTNCLWGVPILLSNWCRALL
jgi:hypothetical protein